MWVVFISDDGYVSNLKSSIDLPIYLIPASVALEVFLKPANELAYVIQ